MKRCRAHVYPAEVGPPSLDDARILHVRAQRAHVGGGSRPQALAVVHLLLLVVTAVPALEDGDDWQWAVEVLARGGDDRGRRPFKVDVAQV